MLKLVSLSAAFAAASCILVSHAQAETYFVNITELSATELSVSMSFPDYPFTTRTLQPIGPEIWSLLPADLNRINGASLDGQVLLPSIAWLEPESNGGVQKYNLFKFGWAPSGYSTTTYMLFYSDLTAQDITSSPIGPNFFDRGCYSGGVPGPCPVLNNGATQHDIPLLRYPPTGTGPYIPEGTMSVTVFDRGDIPSGVPLPSTWTMMLTGFAGVGFLVHRRKSKPALMAA